MTICVSGFYTDPRIIDKYFFIIKKFGFIWFENGIMLQKCETGFKSLSTSVYDTGSI